MEPAQPGPATMSTGDIAAAVRHRSVTALVLFVVAVLGSVVLAQLWPDRYESTALVSVTPMVADPSGDREVELNMATEQLVVTSPDVLSRAAEVVGTDAADLRDRVTVSVPDDSEALDITVASSSPRAAAGDANAVARSYLAHRRGRADALAQTYSDAIEAQIEALLSLPDDVSDGVRRSAEELAAELRSEQSGILASNFSPGELVSPAVPPDEPSSPGLLAFLAAGVVAGLLAAVAGALVRERLDPRLRSAQVLRRHLPYPVVDAGHSAGTLREVHTLLRDLRNDDGTAAEQPPTVVLATSSATADSQAASLTGDVVVVPHHGDLDVARVVAARPAAAFVVLCRVGDRLAEVERVVTSLAEWGRAPSLVVVAGQEGSTLHAGTSPAGTPRAAVPALGQPERGDA